LWRGEELCQFNRQYKVRDFAPGLLVFASKGGGEAFAFDVRQPSQPVVSVEFVAMSLNETIPLAATFDGFLEYLGNL